MAVVVVGLLGLAVLLGAVGPVTAPAASAAAASSPPIGSVIIARSLPGFTAVPPGPTNGPLTATAFAAQSADPNAAEQQFEQLAGVSGFAAAVRLWTDLHGPGQGANDVVVTLFRIPEAQAAATFEEGALQPYEAGGTSTPFAVPSITGAHGYTVAATTPGPAVEQVIVFRSGEYVAIIELASSTQASNPTSLSPSDAIDVAYRQFLAVQRATPAPPPPSGGSAGWVVPVIVAVVVVAAAGATWLVVRRRRRSQPTVGGDPWAPDGILAAMGAVRPVTDRPAESGSGSEVPVPVPVPVPEADVGRDAGQVGTVAGTGAAAPGDVPTAGARRDDPGPGTEPGWLPDPSGAPGRLRYWDGVAWTSHVAGRSTGS